MAVSSSPKQLDQDLFSLASTLLNFPLTCGSSEGARYFGLGQVFRDVAKLLTKDNVKDGQTTIVLLSGSNSIGKSKITLLLTTHLTELGFEVCTLPSLSNPSEITLLLLGVRESEKASFHAMGQLARFVLSNANDFSLAHCIDVFKDPSFVMPLPVRNNKRPLLTIFIYDELFQLNESPDAFRGRAGTGRKPEPFAEPAPELFLCESEEKVMSHSAPFPLCAIAPSFKKGLDPEENIFNWFVRCLLREMDESAAHSVLFSTSHSFFPAQSALIKQLSESELSRSVGSDRLYICRYLTPPSLLSPVHDEQVVTCSENTCVALFVRNQLKPIMKLMTKDCDSSQSDTIDTDWQRLMAAGIYLINADYKGFQDYLNNLHGALTSNSVCNMEGLLSVATTFMQKMAPFVSKNKFESLLQVCCNADESARIKLCAKLVLAMITDFPIDTGRFAVREVLRNALFNCCQPYDCSEGAALNPAVSSLSPSSTQFLARPNVTLLQSCMRYILEKSTITETMKELLNQAMRHFLPQLRRSCVPLAECTHAGVIFEHVMVARLRLIVTMLDLADINFTDDDFSPTVCSLLNWKSEVGAVGAQDSNQKADSLFHKMPLRGCKSPSVSLLHTVSKSVLNKLEPSNIQLLCSGLTGDRPAILFVSSQCAKEGYGSVFHGCDSVLFFAHKGRVNIYFIEMSSSVSSTESRGKVFDLAKKSRKCQKWAVPLKKEIATCLHVEEQFVSCIYVVDFWQRSINSELVDAFDHLLYSELSPGRLCQFPALALLQPAIAFCGENCAIRDKKWKNPSADSSMDNAVVIKVLPYARAREQALLQQAAQHEEALQQALQQQAAQHEKKLQQQAAQHEEELQQARQNQNLAMPKKSQKRHSQQKGGASSPSKRGHFDAVGDTADVPLRHSMGDPLDLE